jgi:hypothetical protein
MQADKTGTPILPSLRHILRHIFRVEGAATTIALAPHVMSPICTRYAAKLDEMQNAYKAAVEKWIAVIKEVEALAKVNHLVYNVGSK